MKFFRRHRYPFIGDKRQRFAVQMVILTTGLLVTQLIWEDYRFFMVSILAFLSYILTIWSLHEDIKGAEWLTLFILPVFFTASASLFYFLLPPRWISRVAVGTLFAIVTYAILLVENIYNVAAERSIQLLRAAQSIGLLISLIVMYLSASIVYSFRLPFWKNMLLLGVISFFLALQSVWTVKLEEKIQMQHILYTFIIAIGIGQGTMALSFWPVESAPYSLLITAAYYSLVSLVERHLSERLFSDTIREYIIVFAFTLLLTFIATSWGN